MNIFGLNITRAPAKKSADEIPLSSLSPDALAWLSGNDVRPEGAVLTNAYQQIPWVYRAINVLAEQVANVPFLFSAGDRGRENLITTGPLADFYAHPHPQINRYQYWELRIIWLMLRGECMRIPVRDARGRLTKVLLLDPARFQHIIDNTQLAGWRYTGLGPNTPLESQVFLPEEVWFEKLPNPYDFWRGMSPLIVASLATKTDFASAAFMHGLIDNNADLGLIVRTQDQLDEPQRQQIIAAINNRKRRAGTADRPLLICSGTEVIKPTLSSADLQFLENRKFTRSEICAAFGVPEEIVTSTDHNKYDVMAGARLNFIENRVAPLCRRLEAEEEATVKALDPRATGWFDLEALPIMQQALRQRLGAAKTAFDMGVPFNHVNRFFDLGFPTLPWGDIGFLPSKYRPLESPALRSLGEEGSSFPDPKGVPHTSPGQGRAGAAALGTTTGGVISLPSSGGEAPAIFHLLSANSKSQFPMDITSRLTPLCDGRQGLRSTIQTDVRSATLSSRGGEGQGEEALPPYTLDFISSDATLDRYGEIISPSGWNLETYRRNPVFQNSHQYGNIIFTLGKALITELRSSPFSHLPSPVLFQRIQFAVDANPIAKIAHALYSGGFLKAVSVGFIPTKWEDGTAQSPFRRKYTEQELLEVSAVAIPANPNALTLALKSGALEKSDLEDTLDVLHQTLGAAAPDTLRPLSPLSPSAPRDHLATLSLLRSIRDQLKHL